MTLEERAKALVDGVASKLDPRVTSSKELGVKIVKEVERVAPGDRTFFMAVMSYMTHLASGCGPNANHECAWKSQKP